MHQDRKVTSPLIWMSIDMTDSIANTIVNKLRMSQHNDLADDICARVKKLKKVIKNKWLPIGIQGQNINLIIDVLRNWGHRDVRGDVLCHVLDQISPLNKDRTGRDRVPTGV